MTEQEKRKKVIRGLEWCLFKTGCNGCPYRNDCDDGTNMEKDALALLQAQEPRVMTLEEVKASKGNDIYLELSSCPDDTPYITAATLDGVGKYGVSFYHTVCNFCNYGRRAYGWRCWTSRPTDAQREAIPWN